jgi:hypothetical protein
VPGLRIVYPYSRVVIATGLGVKWFFQSPSCLSCSKRIVPGILDHGASGSYARRYATCVPVCARCRSSAVCELAGRHDRRGNSNSRSPQTTDNPTKISSAGCMESLSRLDHSMTKGGGLAQTFLTKKVWSPDHDSSHVEACAAPKRTQARSFGSVSSICCSVSERL